MKPIIYNIAKQVPYTVAPDKLSLEVIGKETVNGEEKVRVKIIYTQETQYGYNTIVETKLYPIAFLAVVDGFDFDTDTPKINTVALQEILTNFGITIL